MADQPAKSRQIHCPKCHAVIVWSAENPYRPFCSERCKLIDLGQWATGGYRIPQVERDNGVNEDDQQNP